ncbi:MAG: type II secretion system protein [Chloroflexi bacterium]|nr:MAG: type II secretion system protein [Chloroflexota bacterium]
MIDRKRIRRLLRKLPKNNQKGFTLIELLVVISILGILAAVVTMSMVGITKVAQDRAALTEKQTVQVALDTMLADQGVPTGSECAAAGATDDMSQFPSNAGYTGTAGHVPVSLYPHYLRQQHTNGTYTCGVNGQIAQAAYKP